MFVAVFVGWFEVCYFFELFNMTINIPKYFMISFMFVDILLELIIDITNISWNLRDNIF